MKSTSRNREPVVLRARDNITERWVEVPSIGVMGSGMNDPAAPAENSVGSLIPSARKIVIEPNFPTLCC